MRYLCRQVQYLFRQLHKCGDIKMRVDIAPTAQKIVLFVISTNIFLLTEHVCAELVCHYPIAVTYW
jgi:hypothetical protein